MGRHLTLVYWPYADGLVGNIREVPCIFSRAETLEELEKNVRDAYLTMIKEQRLPVSLTDVKTKTLDL